MADEPENPVLALLRQLAANVYAGFERLDAKTDRMAAEQRAMNTKVDRIAADQMAMRAEFSAKFERTDAKLDRAAVRADDVMGAQVRMATDIAALRAIQEEGGRTLVDGVRQDLESLRDRVEALERGGS
jgi:hypothetical protein